MRNRDGITVVELLVVISILAMLTALIVPAVMQAREAQRRTVCQSNLKNLMLAMAQFESAHGHFPGAVEGQPPNLPGWYCLFSPIARVLPYLDQQSLYEKINFTREDRVPLNPDVDAGLHEAVFRTRISGFVCPSDDRGSTKFGGLNYRISLGIGPADWEKAETPGVGAFAAGKFRRPSEFRDGLSTTIGLSERRVGTWAAGQYSRTDDMWYSGVDAFRVFPPLEDMIRLCASIEGTPAQYYSFSGSTWLYGSFENSWYNHALQPNSAVPPCSSSGLDLFGPLTSYAIVGATSRHSGAVGVTFMDGSVKFVSDSIDLRVWRALATIKESDTVASME